MSNFFQNAGRKFERRLAKELNSKVNPGSGNRWYAPADIPEDSFLIESKLTGQDHYVFHLDDWFLLEENAMKVGKLPVFIIGFFGGLEYAVVNSSIWKQIVDNESNYSYTNLVRKGKSCTRLQQNILRKEVKRIPGSPTINLLKISLAQETFIIIPKQVFYIIKDSYNVIG